MHKALLIAGREFRQRVHTRGFVLGSILTPVLLLVVWATGSFGDPGEQQPEIGDERDGKGPAVVAYVDQAGPMQRTPPGMPETLFRRFEDETSAAQALDAGEVEAYYVVTADYRETGEVRRVSAEIPAGPPQTGMFDQLLWANLLRDADAAQLARAQNPFQSTALQVAAVSGEEAEERDSGLNMMPFLVAMLVMVPLFTSGSYLLASLAEEKSNRVMEILLVSLRPPALLAGKLLGLGALTVVQYAIWLILGGGALLLVDGNLAALSGAVDLTAVELALVFLYALGGYARYATLMAGLGALSPNMEATRSWVFVISLPMLIPIYLWPLIVNSPANAAAVAFSLVPFSAPIVMLMRLASATVPAWQVAISLLLLFVTAVLMVWLMSRLFRVHPLLSREPFSVGRFWRVLREG